MSLYNQKDALARFMRRASLVDRRKSARDVPTSTHELLAACEEIHRLRAELSAYRYKGDRTETIVESLSPKERLFYNLLVAADGAIVRQAAVVQELYGLDPNGGPEDPLAAIRVYLTHIRRKIAGTGDTIKSHTGFGWSYNKGKGNDKGSIEGTARHAGQDRRSEQRGV